MRLLTLSTATDDIGNTDAKIDGGDGTHCGPGGGATHHHHLDVVMPTSRPSIIFCRSEFNYVECVTIYQEWQS